jgi:hypothetical protein
LSVSSKNLWPPLTVHLQGTAPKTSSNKLRRTARAADRTTRSQTYNAQSTDSLRARSAKIEK